MYLFFFRAERQQTREKTKEKKQARRRQISPEKGRRERRNIAGRHQSESRRFAKSLATKECLQGTNSFQFSSAKSTGSGLSFFSGESFAKAAPNKSCSQAILQQGKRGLFLLLLLPSKAESGPVSALGTLGWEGRTRDFLLVYQPATAKLFLPQVGRGKGKEEILCTAAEGREGKCVTVESGVRRE